MSIQSRRKSLGWTQEQLAGHSGLSVRTIQRLEGGQDATLESLKCLAAVFETDVRTLIQEKNMTMTRKDGQSKEPEFQPDKRELEAIEYVQHLKGLYMHGIIFAFVIPCLLALNLFISPDELWIIYVVMAWLAGLAIHAIAMFAMFGLFGPGWEQRQFQRRLDMS